MKKKIAKLVALVTCAAMVFGMTACSGTGAGKKVYNVGICQLVTHPALDAATKGFQDALEEKLGKDNVKFDYQNASGDSANCSTIVNAFVSAKVDLIMANATPPLQAAASATADIPVLGTSITDYASALDIKDWTGKTGYNVSGTSDLAPLSKQAAMIQELFPDVKKVGALYCSAEANSKYQVDVITAELTKLGIECVPYSFTDTNDVATVTENACANVDVLYIPTDNTAASNTGIIDQIARPAKTPIVAGEEGICKGCGVATLSISYYDIGYTTGEMAADILANGADITKMDIQFAPKVTKMYNQAIADELGVTIPDGYEAVVIE